MKVFRFLGSEIRNIVRTKSILVPVLGLLIIPLLYTGIYLIANWDPYSNVKDMPVAVVNEDKPVMYQGKEIAVGREMLKKLKDNDSVQFHFVSKQEAEEGLKNRQFYLIIDIPEGMSQSATTILDPNPKPMKLLYKENSSYNFLSGQISDKIVEKIKNDASKSITETYVEQMFNAIGTVSEGLSAASDGAGDLEEGLTKLGDGIQKFKSQVNSQIDGKIGMADELTDKYIKQYGDVLHTKMHDQIDQAIADNKEPINEEMHRQIDQSVNDKTEAVKQKMHEQLDQAVDQYSGTINEEMHRQIDSTMDQYSESVRQQMHKQMDQAIEQYSGAIKQEIHNQVNTMLSQYSNPIRQMIHQKLDQEIDARSNEIKQYVIQKVDQELNAEFDKIAAEAKKQAAQIDEAFKQFETDIQPVIEKLPPELQEKFKKNLEQLKEAKAKITAWLDDQIPKLKLKVQERVHAIISQKFDELKPEVVAQLHRMVDQKFNELEPVITSMLNGLVDSKFDQLKPVLVSKLHSAADSKFSEMKPEVQNKMHQVADQKFAEMKPKVQNQLNELSEEKFNELQPEFLRKFHELANEKFYTILPKLEDKLHEMANQKFDAGKAAVERIAHDKLGDVKAKVQDAKKTLNGAFDQLMDGQHKLANGGKLLRDKLKDGAEKATQDSSDATYKQFASPVTSDKESNNDVDKYGIGMAPYFLALGLFVGALMFSIVFPLTETGGIPPSALAWHVSKFGVMAIEGLLQTIIVGSFVLYGLGVPVTSVPLFFVVCLVCSLTFFSIVQFFSTSFGNVGRFMVVLLLVFQLSASAGTFPIELAPKFFQAIHPYLPMTYAIRAFRGVLSSGDFDYVWSNIGIISIFLVSCLTGSYVYFRLRYKRLQQEMAKSDTLAV